ncbi:hypothetical protein WJX81_006315 [Elliptochloris bilobata]|uniref:Uncharacterized protein n=1 Tax=Elliptochloris bilobata TaxID=381761 RepID=A0AAW1RJ37_9CHLO
MNKNLQHLNTRTNKPSKFKKIEPTVALDLAKHRPDKYLPLPSNKELELLNIDEMVMVGFCNREDVWITVEALDDNNGTVYGKIVGNVIKMQGLQRGQRVQFEKRHIVSIKYNDDDDDDDE